MTKRTVLIISLSLFWLTACSRVPVPETPGYKAGESATVVRMHTLHSVDRGVLPLVKVVSGAESGWWLLDTGSSHNLISRALAQRLQLSVASSSEIATIGGRQSSTHHRLPVLRIGKLRLDGQSASAVDLSGLSVTDGYQIAGVLGMPALQKLVVALDYRNRTIRFSAGSPAPDESASLIPFELKNGVPVVSLQFPGKRRGNFILDTGNATALVVLPSVALRKREQPLHFVEVADLGGSIPTQLARLKQFSLGARQFRGVPVSLPLNRVHTKGIDGSLGNGILSQQEVTFDFPQRQLTLGRGSQQTIWQAGDFGFLLAQDNVIAVINSNSPAARAGLQRGDKIIAVDGQDTLSASSHTIWRLLAKRRDTALMVRRGQQRLGINLRRELYLPEVE